MAIFSKAELLAKLTGTVDSITDEQYDRALAYAEAYVQSYTGYRYEAVSSSTSTVLKQFALEIGMWHAASEHFKNQDSPKVEALWARMEEAKQALKELAKGERTADAGSVEVERQAVVIATQSSEDVESVFSDDTVNSW